MQRKYIEPKWGLANPGSVKVMVNNKGKVIETLSFAQKSHVLFGRHPICDFQLEHSSLSRQHAVLQSSKTGDLFLFDVGSVAGTFLNGKRIKEGVYEKVRNGDVVRFGESTLEYVVSGLLEAPPKQPAMNSNRRVFMSAEEKRKALWSDASASAPAHDPAPARKRPASPPKPAPEAGLNQWDQADFSSESRKNKFMKLMGAGKGQPARTRASPSTAFAPKDSREIYSQLQNQYNRSRLSDDKRGL
eukprot:GCRY01005579.1.p1 GENE.GCRY01005579.1~~GCRY01005579.1.p1  ORF type:complete len:245 (+),score=31.53 GCRY01005579.1:74-808(+)